MRAHHFLKPLLFASLLALAGSASASIHVINATHQTWTFHKQDVGSGNMYIDDRCKLDNAHKNNECPITPGDHRVKITSTADQSHGFIRLLDEKGRPYLLSPVSGGDYEFNEHGFVGGAGRHLAHAQFNCVHLKTVGGETSLIIQDTGCVRHSKGEQHGTKR